jgi:pyruvate/2-oxoglutarate dehydrogenase complex dihydrolipoamide dehydrogenase (E3) component
VITKNAVAVLPMDEFNGALVEAVHPPAWNNPTPAPTYDLVVLGGGTAGLVSAIGAAGLGARVALVERHLLGGDCLNTGCVPSKAVIRSARAATDVRSAADLGVGTTGVAVDFGAVMRRMRARRARIAHHDAAERVRRAGVDLFFGDARFTSDRIVAVDGLQLRFGRAVIATGGRPDVPAIAGLQAWPFLTSENVFSLTELPRRLLVIGSGPIGCELAQAFARLGSTVTLFGRRAQILPREDGDAAAVVHRRMSVDGVRVVTGATLDRVVNQGEGVALLFTARETESVTTGSARGDAILVAAGRRPTVEGLNLSAAGIEMNEQGVMVDDRLRTTNRRVYAAGDVCSRFKFTHAADAMARIVIQNALFYGRRRASALVIPWVTFTEPELAHVGVTQSDVERSDGRLATITVPLSDVDRAIVDDDTEGFVRVHHARGRIRGVTIVARHAGEMIGEAVYAMTHGGTLPALSATVHPYPTQAEALRKAGDLYRREALTPGLRRWFESYFAWTR